MTDQTSSTQTPSGPVTASDRLFTAVLMTGDDALLALARAASDEEAEARATERQRVEALEKAIRAVLADTESQPGGWGPDVTTVRFLRDALASPAPEPRHFTVAMQDGPDGGLPSVRRPAPEPRPAPLDWWETPVGALLNSLGIAGPNIPHRLQTEPDPKDPATWPSDIGEDWCVCGRVWPCEARELARLVGSRESAAPLDVERLRTQLVLRAGHLSDCGKGAEFPWDCTCDFRGFMDEMGVALAALTATGQDGAVAEMGRIADSELAAEAGQETGA